MKEQFIHKFKLDFGNRLAELFIPGINQPHMYRLIHFELINLSAYFNLPIHNVDIKEVADKEYHILVNHDIKIEHTIFLSPKGQMIEKEVNHES